MKKTKIFSIFALLVCCILIFTGCNLSFSGNGGGSSSSKYYSSKKYLENETLTVENQMSASEIAQSYIDISFTVEIYQVVETTSNGKTTTAENLASYGSGFIVHKGGFILTNYHVIESALANPEYATTALGTTKTSYKVYVSQDGGITNYEAQILWSNSMCDMAIIVCKDFATLKAAKLKDRTIYCPESEKIGLLETVITVGNQKSYHASATMGTISSTQLRIASSSSNVYEHLIQHNASINHGNSGGALIDLKGNVIGLNTLGDDDANSLFFAVSIYPAIVVLDKVVENYYADGSATKELTLGITGIDKDKDHLSGSSYNVSESGFYVTEVSKDCLVSGIQEGDYVVSVEITWPDGTTSSLAVRDSNTLLYARISLLYAQSAVFKIKRGGSIVSLTMNI